MLKELLAEMQNGLVKKRFIVTSNVFIFKPGCSFVPGYMFDHQYCVDT